MSLVWKTNFTNPYNSCYIPSRINSDETYLQALQRDQDLFNRFIKGRPQATSTYTTEELEAMGMIGLYELVSSEE